MSNVFGRSLPSNTDLTQENDKSFLVQFSENRDQFIIILGYHFAGSSCYNSDWKSLSLSWVIILQGQVVIILTGKSLSFFGLSFWRFTFFCEKRSIYHFAGFDSCWNSSYFEVIILQVRIIYVSSIPVLALLLDFRAFWGNAKRLKLFLVFYTCFVAMPNVFQLFSNVLHLLRGNAKRFTTVTVY